MPVLDQLASSLNRNDELPNQDLARALAVTDDTEAIQELVDNLTNTKKAIQSDCIKVLYEIGEIKPVLIAPYVDEFVNLLASRNNRLVWGAMTALGLIADIRGAEIWTHIDRIVEATETGSVITQDWGIRVLAQLAAQDTRYAPRIVPFLDGFLKQCPAKDLPRHAESCLVAVNDANRDTWLQIFEARLPALKPSQAKRIKKVIGQIKQS